MFKYRSRNSSKKSKNNQFLFTLNFIMFSHLFLALLPTPALLCGVCHSRAICGLGQNYNESFVPRLVAFCVFSNCPYHFGSFAYCAIQPFYSVVALMWFGNSAFCDMFGLDWKCFANSLSVGSQSIC